MATVEYKQGMTAGLYSIPDGLYIGNLGLNDQEQYFQMTTVVASSRSLTVADNGNVLECTATVTLTVPVGLPVGFRCKVIPSGTTSIASDGTSKLNGDTVTLTRTSAANALFEIVGRASVADSYVVSGA